MDIGIRWWCNYSRVWKNTATLCHSLPHSGRKPIRHRIAYDTARRWNVQTPTNPPPFVAPLSSPCRNRHNPSTQIECHEPFPSLFLVVVVALIDYNDTWPKRQCQQSTTVEMRRPTNQVSIHFPAHWKNETNKKKERKKEKKFCIQWWIRSGRPTAVWMTDLIKTDCARHQVHVLFLISFALAFDQQRRSRKETHTHTHARTSKRLEQRKAPKSMHSKIIKSLFRSWATKKKENDCTHSRGFECV